MKDQKQRSLQQLSITGIALLILFSLVSILAFPLGQPPEDLSSIPWMVGLLIASFSVYLLAIKFATRVQKSKSQLIATIWLVAITLRLVMLFSAPVLEIDFYRYLWDGKVVNVGVSPYKYSPQQIIDGSTFQDQEYKRLSALANHSESVNTIVSRIHFEEYTTIYPPVSQCVLALAMRCVPHSASVEVHVFSLKAFLILFDIGTVLCVAWLLKTTKTHLGWLVAYAWNPLLIKEIANSAHLDSIAVFFMMAAICMVVRIPRSEIPNQWKLTLTVAAAIALAFGVGAKLFPMLLFPALAMIVVQAGYRQLAVFTFIFVSTTALILFPMFQHHLENRSGIDFANSNNAVGKDLEDVARETTESQNGLKGFLSKWRMNDVLFSLVYENIKPDIGREIDRPWYRVTDTTFRQQMTDALSRFNFLGGNTAYSVARFFTLAVFAIVYLMLLVRIKNTSLQSEAARVLETLFFVLAVFFFLQPTQNPWYWCWAMPLMVFAANRGWLVVSGALFIYYLRFWMQSWHGTYSIGSFEYSGEGLFTHIVVWIELTVILVALYSYWQFKPASTTNQT